MAEPMAGPPSGFDHDRIEKAVREILFAIGRTPIATGSGTPRPAWPARSPSSSPAWASGPKTR